MNTLTLAVSLAGLASAAAADVLVVDADGSTPGSLTTIQAAITSALPGDTVLVTGTGNEAFDEELVVSGKGIHLIADVGVTPCVNSLFITNVPASETMAVRGLRVDAAASPTSEGAALRLTGCQGSVHLESCEFQGAHGFAGSIFEVLRPYNAEPAAVVTNVGELVVHQCSFEGGAGGILEDEDVGWTPTNGGNAIQVTGSIAHFSATTFTGGEGGASFALAPVSGGSGGDGVHLSSTFVSLAGCTAVGKSGKAGDEVSGSCGDGGHGGDGVELNGTGSLLISFDTTASGANGGSAGSSECTAGTTGEAFDINEGTRKSPAGLFRDFTTSSPVRPGETLALSLNGLAGDTISLGGAFENDFFFVPKSPTPYLLGSSIAPGVFVVGNLIADGALDIPVAIPSLSGLDAVHISLQMFTVDGMGDVLFGPSSNVTLLGELTRHVRRGRCDRGRLRRSR